MLDGSIELSGSTKIAVLREGYTIRDDRHACWIDLNQCCNSGHSQLDKIEEECLTVNLRHVRLLWGCWLQAARQCSCGSSGVRGSVGVESSRRSSGTEDYVAR